MSFARLFLSLMAGALSAFATPIYYLTTGQTGAQTQIDINHTSSWTLTPTFAFDLGGGSFEMKAGSSAAATALLTLYQGTSQAGTILGQVTLTNLAFCTQVSNCGAFGVHDFFFGSAVPLSVGTTYFVALTSLAADVQSQAYFIKAANSFIGDASGNPIIPPPIDGGTGGQVPEPSSLLLAGVGLLAIGLVPRWRWALRSSLEK